MFVLVLAVGFVALGWWQYTRFEAAGGNARNLGYALQWPMFAVAAVWGYKRFVELEEEAGLLAEAHGADSGRGAVGRPATGSDPRRPTALPEGFLPARLAAATAPTRDAAPGGAEDDAHDQYNRLLAEIAASDDTQEH